ncbi:DMT family transporter [Streptomyces netropsis]|uniref:Drug/metabolite transporter (DMT)-like permease n=1 Tax=Streptomyces netropsis TaxID=55404 RepID=A0A7W7LDL0_STRNE|nr:DMT family transporter [Streptomyces netropsis]MBB4888263.1 drug/metabolite transporter (DMT)-like permease [Streptomyces netropsis]
MSSLMVSVLLCLISAAAYAAAAIAQERVAATSDGVTYAPLRRPGWWGAVALTGVGATLHVVALAFGPLSLVQPLGALTLVFALPMAALLVHRPVGAAGWRGAILATVGLAGLLSLTGTPHPETLGGAERPVLAAVVLGAVAALVLAAHRMRRPVVRGVMLASAAGAAFGMASVFTKAAAEDWTDRATGSLLPTLGVIAVLATAGLLLSQAAYRGAGLAAPLATVTVVNPVVAAAVGITVLGEGFRYGVTGGVLAFVAGAVATTGVVMLTVRDVDRGAPAVPRAEGGAASGPVPTAESGRPRRAVSPAEGCTSGPVPTAGPAGPRRAASASAPGAEPAPEPRLPGARPDGRCLVPARSAPEDD